MNEFAKRIMGQKYLNHDLGETTWEDIAARCSKHVLGALGLRKNSTIVTQTQETIASRKFIPGGRYLYATGRPLHQVQNCVLLRAQDSREGWADHLHKNAMSLMTGAGAGNVYSDIRASGTTVRRTGGKASGPIPLMQMTNEAGRGIRQGGDRRSALWAGLHWDHKDIMEFIRIKDWSPEVRALKDKDYNFPATMDGTNVSVILDTKFFAAYNNEKHPLHVHARSVYTTTVRQMLKTGEPGFSVDHGVNEGENLRNACTEVTSKDDSDICNLGSINLSQITSLDDMREAVQAGVRFLLAGTVYSDVPYSKIDTVRTKNRRLGLGLMGVHDWLLARGKPYGPDAELEEYLKIYAESTQVAADFADEYELSAPVKTRAIAPTGTISIVTGCTSGMEPIFCVAYKRRYLKGNTVNYEYVIDPGAKRLIDSGVDPDRIEDAYSIEPSRRIAFQAWLQKYVDHGISSTINLPAWGSEANNDSKVEEFGNMLMTHLPNLRGITAYPDGARGGQPLTTVKYTTAIKHLGEVFEEAGDICDITKGGTCGS